MFRLVKERWKQELLNSGISGKVQEYTQKWNLDIFDIQQGICWDQSNDMSIVYGRVYALAYFYSNPDNEWYRNESLKHIILKTLDWMYHNRYGIKEKEGCGWRDIKAFNWWDWEIGSPTQLINTLFLMQRELEETCQVTGTTFPELVRNYLEVFHFLVPGQKDYGANRLCYASLLIRAAILENDHETVRKQLTEILDMYEYCDDGFNDGQGFYSDGTYIFHTRHPMNATYGYEFFRRSVELCLLFDGTELALPDEVKGKLIHWYKTAFIPIVQHGAVIRSMLGREPGEADLIANGIVHMGQSVLQLAPDDKQIQMFVNGEKAELTQLYYFCDKAVHAKKDYSFVLSMSSSRIYNYECINSQNMTGWYISDGMTGIYNENNRYLGDYWDRVNPYLIPGTTVDTQKRTAATIRQSNEYLSSEDFVGGAVLDEKYMTAAMCLESYHSDGNFVPDDKFAGSPLEYGGPPPKHDCTLKAKKAWFCFDDEIVCLGTDIHAEDGYPVLTVVENLPVENCGKSYCTEQKLWLENIGTYVAMDNHRFQYRQDNGFVTALIEHGISPKDEGYAYVIVPKKAKCAYGTENLSDKTVHSEILVNNSRLQAVRCGNVTGIVFYEAGEFCGVEADQPCIVMMSENEISFSDPTHKLEQLTVKVKGQEFKLLPQYGESICIELNKD